MEWQFIKENYPKSFQTFVNRMFPNIGVLSLYTLNFFDNKKLYKFFDEQGVYLNVERCGPNVWVFTISLNNGCVIGSGDGSKSNREEIEKEGFKDCFKTLERKLEVVYE